jgi:hypothetical protein
VENDTSATVAAVSYSLDSKIKTYSYNQAARVGTSLANYNASTPGGLSAVDVGEESSD